MSEQTMAEKKSSRILINLIGIPSLLLIIILGDSFNQLPIFSFFIIIVLILGACEIPIFLKDSKGELNLTLLFTFLLLLQINRYPFFDLHFPLLEMIIAMTFLSMTWELLQKKESPFLNISSLLFAFIWLGIMLGSLTTLRNIPIFGFQITMALFLSVWICDTAAFGFGLKFGKSKILPKVSPNKTWVGCFAGLIFSIILMIILFKLQFFNVKIEFIDVLCLGFIVGIFGQLGDFVESLLKREASIKDTSDILRGHGGILDRFDSLSFAAPLTLLYCNYFIN